MRLTRIFTLLATLVLMTGLASAQAPAKVAEKSAKAAAKAVEKAPAKAAAKAEKAADKVEKVAEKAADKAGALIDINRATPAELKTIPGVGEAYSAAIIKGRPYANKAQLKSKNIVPDGVYEKIKDKIIAKQ